MQSELVVSTQQGCTTDKAVKQEHDKLTAAGTSNAYIHQTSRSLSLVQGGGRAPLTRHSQTPEAEPGPDHSRSLATTCSVYQSCSAILHVGYRVAKAPEDYGPAHKQDELQAESGRRLYPL